MLSKATLHTSLNGVQCDSVTDDDDVLPTSELKSRSHYLGTEDSATESESLIEIEDDGGNDFPPPRLPMGPPLAPLRLSMKKHRRGPYKVQPKPVCLWDYCGQLSTSARSKYCQRHKEHRRRIRDQFRGSFICTVSSGDGKPCKNKCFRKSMCRKHYAMAMK